MNYAWTLDRQWSPRLNRLCSEGSVTVVAVLREGGGNLWHRDGVWMQAFAKSNACAPSSTQSRARGFEDKDSKEEHEESEDIKHRDLRPRSGPRRHEMPLGVDDPDAKKGSGGEIMMWGKSMVQKLLPNRGPTCQQDGGGGIKRAQKCNFLVDCIG